MIGKLLYIIFCIFRYIGYDSYSGMARNESHTNCTSWITELDGKNKQEADSLLGLLDTSYLMSYAVFMFVSGMVAERVNLRNFLAFGMATSGIFTILFGLGRYWQIHSLAYYIAIQVHIFESNTLNLILLIMPLV